jgi:hypothetical protein
MVVCDLAATNDHVMRKDTSDGFVEATADGFIGNLERREGLGPSSAHVSERLLGEVKRASRGIGLEVSPGAVALESVAPLRNLPLKLDFRFGRRPGQQNFHAVAGSFDVTDIYEVRERGDPEPGDRAAASIEREMIAGALVKPAGRHDPCVVAVEVAPLRLRDRGLVPRMLLIDRIAERIVCD